MSQPPSVGHESPAVSTNSNTSSDHPGLKSRKARRRFFNYVYSFVVGLAATGTYYAQLIEPYYTPGIYPEQMPLPIAFGSVVGLGLFLFLSAAFNSLEEGRNELATLSKEADRELDTMEDAGDILALLRYNRSQMMEYDKAAKLQEQRANRSAQMATWVGFLIIAAGALVVLIRPLNTSQTIATTALLACGAALSGYCARTFFQAARAATQNSVYYFQNPLAVSYLLQAERLAETLPEDEGTAQKEEVIRAFIQQADYASRAAVPRVEGGDEDV